MEFDNLDELKILLATAEAGSLTAAGRRCGLSTAAVSAALKRLETSLGVRLFERTTRVVRPTPQGEVMIDHARRAMDLLAQGQAQARQGSGALLGTLRVTVSASMAHEMAARWLADFVDQHPGLQLDLRISDAHLDLVREGIDLALRHGPLPDSTHHARLLAPAHRVACASLAYLARHGTPQQPQDLLRGHVCLSYYVRHGRLDQWTFSTSAGAAPCVVKVQGPLLCNDASVAQQWALQGRGVLYQSELALAPALRCGALVRLFPGHVGDPVPLYAVFPSARFLPAKVRALVAYLGQCLETG